MCGVVGLHHPILGNGWTFAYTHPWTSVVVLGVASMVLY